MTATPAIASGLHTDANSIVRCQWCGITSIYQRYHDTEWGFPVGDDRQLYENVCLEGFQAGLSWLTILNKRDAFRRGFAQFDMDKVAKFGEKDIERLVADAGIVRHRGKIEATINNAQRAIEMRTEFGSLAAYFWRFEPHAASRPKVITHDAFRAMPPSEQAAALSKDLKKRGWKFVAPTTIYAFMQAVGLVNDHLEGCSARKLALAARRKFKVASE
jgi:DNA-3-methyladenine glycosylase I